MPDSLHLPIDDVHVPFSILDTDLYKLTMQNAVLHHFSDAHVVIKFTNRSPQMLFSKECFDWVQQRVNDLSKLKLAPEERKELSKACPYFSESYLDYLSNMQLDPVKQVKLTFISQGSNEKGEEMGEIGCVIEGPWKDTILYEVPIMAILSEGYFKFVDTDWDYDGQFERAKKKALDLLNPPAPTTSLSFSEFGTRRRRSFKAQDIVLRGLIAGYEEYKSKGGNQGILSGTSNVYLALKYGLNPVGTIAHEWIMAIGATYEYRGANGRAMDMWEEVYPPGTRFSSPLTMLTDTYTAAIFFKDFMSDPARALRWAVLRQDSGDAFKFVEDAKKVWKTIEDKAGLKRDIGANGEEEVAKGKKVIFSDGLDVEKAIKLQQGCDKIGMAASFGIGTDLTNDFRKASDPSQKSKALNMVIKLNKINGKDCIKLSDDKGKHTGSLEEVRKAQQELGIEKN
ncbi:nicotinate phosphoribosyltransferase [Cryptococcus neoformans]|nr:nicotinate phosphoribosyltransferase [Cryptococcus neoformans var. grubii AD1-83a]OWZ55148.1 nicotinate phosphoribosyltransferase [Cryptococcus neoformans var. grubii 125.91]OXG48448.1 nicotinate phosphoribosyltransferase [Cryptococcus neoformans var. grubii Th84]OXG63045.1 nicotinate phosphoribosyltransferase [Cryptococcus neoformans var. grubii MW-RSA1955]OXG66253.1 nicotinate phosphoribosyltransferase [Cryptococcus neoformans var. grubii c8]OXG68047.1 nicotinate phosphoribosyltransferase